MLNSSATIVIYLDNNYLLNLEFCLRVFLIVCVLWEAYHNYYIMTAINWCSPRKITVFYCDVGDDISKFLPHLLLPIFYIHNASIHHILLRYIEGIDTWHVFNSMIQIFSPGIHVWWQFNCLHIYRLRIKWILKINRCK